jgi:hypothetical protein
MTKEANKYRCLIFTGFMNGNPLPSQFGHMLSFMTFPSFYLGRRSMSFDLLYEKYATIAKDKKTRNAPTINDPKPVSA